MPRLFALALALTACSSDPAHAPDATLDAAPDARAIDGATGCNALAVPGSVAVEQIASAPPVAQGGTIAAGMYAVTVATVYTGPGGATGPNGLVSSVGTLDTATTFAYVQHDKGTSTELRLVGTYTTNGIDLVVTDTCPDTVVRSFTFDATPSSYTTYQANQDGTTLVLVYTKQ